MAEFLSGITKLSSATLGLGTALGSEVNAYKAMVEDDPEKRQLYSARDLCIKRMGWEKLKFTLLAIIVPFLLIIIFLVINSKYKISEKHHIYNVVYYVTVPWLMIGIIVGIYKSYFGWDLRVYELTNAKKINVETCHVDQ